MGGCARAGQVASIHNIESGKGKTLSPVHDPAVLVLYPAVLVIRSMDLH